MPRLDTHFETHSLPLLDDQIIGGDNPDLGEDLTSRAEHETKPGRKIKNEVMRLAQMYRKRTMTQSYTDGAYGLIFGTRYYDGSDLEEVYELDTSYTNDQKNGISDTVSVSINTKNGDKIRIIVDKADNIVVFAHDHDFVKSFDQPDEWSPVFGDDAQSIIDDFSHRSMIAASIHSDRSEEDKDQADEDALRMIRERRPDLIAKRSPIE